MKILRLSLYVFVMIYSGIIKPMESASIEQKAAHDRKLKEVIRAENTVQFVQLLQAYGDINRHFYDNYGEGTLLNALCRRRCYSGDMLKKLLEYPELDVNKATAVDYPLRTACLRGNDIAVNLLLKHPNIIVTQRTSAAPERDYISYRLMGNAYADVNRGSSLLHITITAACAIACYCYSPELLDHYYRIAELLSVYPWMVDKTNIDAFGNTPLADAQQRHVMYMTRRNDTTSPLARFITLLEQKQNNQSN